MWMEYFKVVKIKPGRVNTALFGLIDFSNPNIPLEKITELYENGFPYLEITQRGKEIIYGVGAPDVSGETGTGDTVKTTTTTQAKPRAKRSPTARPKTIKGKSPNP